MTFRSYINYLYFNSLGGKCAQWWRRRKTELRQFEIHHKPRDDQQHTKIKEQMVKLNRRLWLFWGRYTFTGAGVETKRARRIPPRALSSGWSHTGILFSSPSMTWWGPVPDYKAKNTKDWSGRVDSSASVGTLKTHDRAKGNEQLLHAGQTETD